MLLNDLIRENKKVNLFFYIYYSKVNQRSLLDLLYFTFSQLTLLNFFDFEIFSSIFVFIILKLVHIAS